MSDSIKEAPKKPAAARKKPAPRVTNPLENLHLKSSKRGNILPPQRFANEPKPEPRKRAASVKKVPTVTKKKVEKKKSAPKKKAATTRTTKKVAPKKSNVVNNLSPVIAVAASS